jgi:co-chaperonin GroES (HSP10)
MGPTAYTDLSVPEEKRPRVGDFVLWAKYAGVGVIDPETNEKLVILNDEDVLCILKRGEK